jgi:hypothetical protein
MGGGGGGGFGGAPMAGGAAVPYPAMGGGIPQPQPYFQRPAGIMQPAPMQYAPGVVQPQPFQPQQQPLQAASLPQVQAAVQSARPVADAVRGAVTNRLPLPASNANNNGNQQQQQQQQQQQPGVGGTQGQLGASAASGAQATDTRGQTLGGVYQYASVAPVAAASWQRPAYAAAPAAASLTTAAPGPPLALRLRNACAGAQLQALAYLKDEAAGRWRTVGFFDLKPGASAEAGRTANRVTYVYAQEAGGRGCEAGGRCWRGESGPWALEADPGRGFKFIEVKIPDGQASYTYDFEC